MIKQMRIHGAHIIDIAHHIGCSEHTVRRHLTEKPVNARGREPMRKFRPFMDYVDLRLREHVWNTEVIYQEIKQQGYDGRRSMLRQYVHPKRALRAPKQTVRFEMQPGQQLQHNWGEIETVVNGQRCKVNFAVNTLGYSRHFHAWATDS